MFRQEVIEARKESFGGPAFVAVPLSWQAMGLFLFVCVFTVAILIFAVGFSRVENATGTIVPDKGIVPIIPLRDGTISEVFVEEGQTVRAGDPLVGLDIQAGMSDDAILRRIDDAMQQRGLNLQLQQRAAAATLNAQLRQLQTLEGSLVVEVSQIEDQIGLQKDLVESSRSALEKALEVAERGFIGERDIRDREESLLRLQQGLSQLELSLTTKQAALENVRVDAQRAASEAQSISSQIGAAQAQLDRELADLDGERSMIIEASVDGVVTALTAKHGQPVTPLDPLLTIIPADSALQAKLLVPTSAIGFIAPGQNVSLAIDTFPYQQFGTVPGKISTVAQSPISERNEAGESISVYPVTVEIDRTGMNQFWQKERLLPGMKLQARIVAEESSLLEWLFEPLAAITARQSD